MTKSLLRRIWLFSAIAFLFIQCTEDEEAKSPLNKITEFSISSISPEVTGSIDVENLTIEIDVPSGADLTTLSPSISVSENATVSPASGTSQDFTNPVIYTVTAENGTSVEYTVTVNVLKNTNAKIETFGFKGFETELAASIDEENKMITAVISRDYDITKLKPTIIISDLASVTPASETEVDFSEDVIYTVVAEDSTEVNYTVSIRYELRTGNAMVSFDLEEFTPVVNGTIDEDSKTVSLTLPWNTSDLTALVPTIEISEGATVSPENNSAQDFSFGSVDYTVTAEDGSTQVYEVTVELEEAPDPVFDDLSSSTFRKGELITISGQNFSDISVTFVREGFSSSPSLETESETSFSFTVPNNVSFEVGTYSLEVYIRNEEFVLGEVDILPPPPSISDFTTSNSDDNIIVRINGINFIDGENKVSFIKDNVKNEAYIKEENSSRIYAVLPPLLETGDYTIAVETNGAEVSATNTINVEANTTTDPIIAGVESLIVKKGQKLVINGKNFGAGSGSVIIGFMDGWTSTKTKTADRISDSLVELVIPNDLPVETYTIYVQRYNDDFSTSFSNHFYNIVIED
ncbi:DUF5018 domain-containing protein [Marivirga harenae]|uniref:DUF5018 domain-containing protein n=1 Tax=Marivirga harenae TaxID=2010992 RepID=UPI0026E02854|nr:DUF5018 domain-containing protein [Marivirga harenae]WKV11617.1 DUF5018 domain-containing protein [Marivirga harenae]